MKRANRKYIVLAWALLAAACSDNRRNAISVEPLPDLASSGPIHGPGPNDPADMAIPPASTPYPPGPYGNQIGETMPDVSAPGYLANQSWSTSVRLSQLRANPACKCIVVTIGASWCGACQYEQPDLVSDVSSDAGFCVLGILQEGPSGDVATRPDLDAWEGTYHQNFPVLQGNASTEQLMSGYGSSVGLPFTLIMKASTMTVLDNVQGYDSNLHAHARSLCQY